MSEPEPMDQHLSPGTKHLLEEVRAVSPAIDWSRVEARLFDEHGAVRDAQVVRGRFGVARIAAGLAIAASFTLALVSPSRQAKEPAPAVATRAALVDENGHRALHVGDVIEGGKSGDVLRADGRIEIHLAPGSRVKLLDDGERILLSLDEGSLAASVVPVAGGEPFAVDVGSRRVAVHGTKLLVAAPCAANGGVVQVAVSEGSAVVGTTHGDGRTEGALVPAGSVGRFGEAPVVVRDVTSAARLVEAGLAPIVTASATGPTDAPAVIVPDVATTSVAPAMTDDVVPEPKAIAPKVDDTPKPATTSVAPPVATTAAPTTDTVAAPQATTVAPPPGKGLEAAQVAPTLGKLMGSILQCVPRTSAGITFSISTHMTLSIEPSGAIGDVSFDDAPLDTKLASCVRGATAKFTFPAATARTMVTRAVVLGGKK